MGAFMVAGLITALVLLVPGKGSDTNDQVHAARIHAFLEDQLPLKVVLTTPTDVLQSVAGQKVLLSGRQALTAVFSRPAIALGSDFGNGSASGKFPFSLDCKVPGKMRWVTTAIARYDPDVDWPSDLACNWAWNTQFTAYDGAALQLDNLTLVRPLASGPLQLSSSTVSSEKAANLTDGLWAADLGLSDDTLPEVPPDGQIQMSFSSPVNLKMLASSLVLSKGSGGGQLPGLDALPCYSPLPGAAVNLDINDTCAVVKPKRGLASGAYTLRLPAGSSYHALSGPLGQDLVFKFGGLRSFRIPFRPLSMPSNRNEYAYDAVRYRRLELWLPHGLAEGVTPDQLLPLISVCQYVDGFDSSSACSPLNGLSLEALDKGRLLLTVPSLQPLLKYRISVAASGEVKDGYGQALQPSSSEFWTAEVPASMTPPALGAGSLALALVEGVGDPAESAVWRYAARAPASRPAGGSAPLQRDPSMDSVQSVAAWSVGFSTDDEVLKLYKAASGTYGLYLPSLLGPPTRELARDASNAGWQQLDLALPGPSSVHIVATCCSKVTYPETRDANNAVQLIMKSNLSMSVLQAGSKLTAWVVSSAQGGSAVAGAEVLLLARPFDSQQAAFVASRCTTDASGICAMDIGGARTDLSYAAFARSGGQASLVQASSWTSSSLQPWLATLVLDRLVVVPGDSLKVTGFVQQVAAGGKLQLPTAMEVPLYVTPPFVPSNNYTIVMATLNGETGTLHAEVPVPKDAKMAQYSLSLRLPGSASASGPGHRRRLLTQRRQQSLGILPRPRVGSARAAAGRAGRALLQGGDSVSAPTPPPAFTSKVHKEFRAPQRQAMVPPFPPEPPPPPPPSPPGGSALTTFSMASPPEETGDEGGANAGVSGDGTIFVVPGDGGSEPKVTEASGPEEPPVQAIGSPAPSGGSGGSGSGGSSGSTGSGSTGSGSTGSGSAGSGSTSGGSGGSSSTGIGSTGTGIVSPGGTGSIGGEGALGSAGTPGATTPTTRQPPTDGSAGSTGKIITGTAEAMQYDSWHQTASSSFTVADPRPPTAELQVTAPSWTKPDGAVKVDVAAVSYIGASVDGAEMTLTWSHAKAKGQIKLVTDAGGAASTTIDLGALPAVNLTVPGDSMSIEVEWIGPTRERIVKDTTCSIQAAPRVLSLSRSMDTQLPGIAFGVRGDLTSSGDSSAVQGVPIAMTLKPNATNGPDAASAACTGKQLTATCAAPSGEVGYAGCQLALPCPGVFVLEGCAAAGDSPAAGQACTNMTLGVSERDWAEEPWNMHDKPQLWGDKPSYSIGDTAVLSFQNPWAGARALVQWGNVNKLQTKAVLGSLTADGVATISITLGDECTGGCGVTLVLDVPRQPGAPYPPGQGPIPGVAVSRLFDPLGPHTHSLSTTLKIDAPNNLAVAVSVSGGSGTITDASGVVVQSVEPGASVQVAVDVKLPGGAAADGVEVTLYAVDESFLALAPYPLPKPQADMVLDLAAQFSVFGPDVLRLAPSAVREVFSKLMARLTGIDPWLPVDTQCYPQWPVSGFGGGGSGRGPTAAVDMADAEYLKGVTSQLTYMPAFGFGGCSNGRGGIVCMDSGMSMGDVNFGKEAAFLPFMASVSAVSNAIADDAPGGGAAQVAMRPAAGAAAVGVAENGTGGDATSSGVAVRVSDDFVVTPLFMYGSADDAGRATFTFKAPPNLGTFALRAFAASGSAAKYGSGEGRVVVKRRLSLTPSLPRFVRVGDTFEAGAVVTVGSAPATVTVTAKLAQGSAIRLKGQAQRAATFEAGVQQELRFSFEATAMGSANLTITAALDGSDATDGLQLELDVLGQQGDVWVATSFAIAANGSTATWQEGMELPAAVPGSGGLALTAGIGYFPTIDGLYRALQEQEKTRDTSRPSASLALLWATLPALLSYYGRAPSAEQQAAINRAFGDLATLTDSNLGLMSYRPTPNDNWWPTRPDLWLNTWAVYLLQRHAAAYSQPENAAYAAQWQAVSALGAGWRSAADRELVQRATDARSSPYNPGPYSDWSTLAWVRYVFGRDWAPASMASQQVLEDIAFARLLGAAKDSKLGLDAETKVLVALTLIAAGDAGNAFVTTTVDDITSSLRVQGRTAYVAATPGSQSPADVATQSLSLELLLKTSQTHLLVPKLAAYVANPFKRSGLYDCVYPPSDRDTSLTCSVLAAYDTARGSAQPNLQLEAKASDISVLQAAFTPASNAPVSNTTPWEALHSPPGDLTFKATGTGEVSIAASLHFVPGKLLAYPSYRGIYVETAIQLLEPFTGSPTGKPLKTIPLASVVAYTVQITSPDNLGAVTVSVMMPGGLEPLDPNVPGSSGGINGASSPYCPVSWLGTYWQSFFWGWYWPICPVQETRPSVVTFNYAALMAGTSTVTVRAVAASVGSFVLPPVRAYADDQPEVMGMTAGGALTVCQGCQPEYAEAGPALKACPANCGGNGICNPIQGKCTCDSGYKGVDCTAAM